MKKALSFVVALAAFAGVSTAAHAYVSMSVCSATLNCGYGYVASCTVYAEAATGTSCEWWIGPNYVHCAGFDMYGNWEVFNVACPAVAYPLPY